MHDAGDLAAAERLYREILAVEPNHHEALHQLGLLRMQAGDAAAAVPLIARSLDLHPDAAEVHADLATANYFLGRYRDAITLYESALIIDPDNAEAHYGLGIALQALELTEEAIACFQRALCIAPDYPEAYCALAAALRKAGCATDAITKYEAALAIDPNYEDAVCGLADALRIEKRFDDAITHYKRAVALRPDVRAHVGLGISLQAVDRYDEALAHFNAATALDPDSDEASVSLGTALEELGRGEEARAAFERAFALRPRKASNCYALAMSQKLEPNSPCLAVMEELINDPGRLRDEGQEQLHFALGKVYSDQGRNSEGFAHVLAGNSIMRRRINYDETATLEAIDRIGATFTRAFMHSHAGEGDQSRLPIFIVGMPRSGSTLVEQILGNHPHVFAGGERSDFAAAIRAAGLDGSASTFPDAVRAMGAGELRKIASNYLDRLTKAMSPRGPLSRMTDKMPANFLFIGLIHLAFPNARIIHTCRSPVDTCLSCFSTMFDQPYSCDLGELGRYYSTYRRLMDHWRSVLPDNVMIDAQYEEVVADVEGQARRIVSHCDLPWSDACLSFYKADRPVRTASMSQVRQPIYRSSLRRWRPSALALRPLLEGLGEAIATTGG